VGIFETSILLSANLNLFTKAPRREKSKEEDDENHPNNHDKYPLSPLPPPSNNHAFYLTSYQHHSNNMPVEFLPTPSPLLIPSTSHSVNSTITFTAPLTTTKPGEKWYVDINNRKNKNYQNEVVNTTIFDLRGQERNTHIDTTGFQALTSPSSTPSGVLLSGDDKAIERIYYPEVEALLLKHTGMFCIQF
jgi:hypothetical protein